MFNQVILMGRICNDLNLKNTMNGVTVLNFDLAVERSHKDASGERPTDFFTCTAWRGTAETIAKYFSKGRLILITGELFNSQWTDSDGNPRQKTQVNVESISFTGEKAASPRPESSYSVPQVQSRQAPAAIEQLAPERDDYPF